MAASVSGRFPIYIVDDDPDVREAMAFAFATLGRSSRTFAGGREFLEAADSLAAGPVLLDLRMAEIDGIRVLMALETYREKFPTIIMSGHGEAGLAVRSLILGAVDFLEKPMEEELLLHSLAQAELRLAPQPLP